MVWNKEKMRMRFGLIDVESTSYASFARR